MAQWWEKKEESFTVWAELQTEDGLTYYYNTQTNETTWDCPEELLTDADRAKQGEWVWVPDDREVFVPGKVSQRANGFMTVETDDGRRLQFPESERLEQLRWTSLQRITPDLVLLDALSDPLILHNLRKRFERGDIYTNIGTILISINPFTELSPPLYSADVVEKYRSKLADLKDMPPHVFVIADNAFKGLSFANGANQSVVISGESGAGKTEAAKQVVSYLAAVAGSVSNVEQKLFVSNPILESFGNAKTIRNNNSSRFGKYMEICFDNQFRINGAEITNYLLEKIRVPQPGPDERNYHIFYQLCESGSQMAQLFGIGSAQNYNYLNRSGCLRVDGIDDRADMNDTLNAMDQMGFSQSEKSDVFQVVAAVLHVGNITTRLGGEGVQIVDRSSLASAATCLGVDQAALEKRLTYRTVVVPGQTIDVPLDKANEADDARDACPKFVYAALFDWIVDKLNSVMNLAENRWKSVGILDIFGFEIFELNSLEQLCINYCNEILQQNFTDNVFKLEEELYKSEGIDFVHVPYIDNEPIVRLIEDRPFGIMNLFDEEVILPQGSEKRALQKLVQNQSKNDYFFTDKRYGEDSFLLIHYAGTVAYDTRGFLEKNRDTLTQDLMDMCTQSHFEFLSNLFKSRQEQQARNRKKTLCFQFRGQLRQLRDKLSSTEPHYIRCVKPNGQKAPLTFFAKNCQEQLTYAGVFEAVKIRKSGFPFRLLFSDFVARYACMIGQQVSASVDGCREILGYCKFPPENVQMGRTMVLYRAEEHRKLELDRSIVLEQETLQQTLAELCNTDPNTLPNPDNYFRELAQAVSKANRLNLRTPIAERARQLLDAFIEARIDPETKALLEEALQTRDYERLKYALELVDQYGYNTRLCKKCRKLRDFMTRVIEESAKARDTLEDKPMEVCLAAADRCGYSDENTEHFRYMFSLSKDKYYQEQLRAATRLGDKNRQIRISIKLKDIFFDASTGAFTIKNYERLKLASYWASEKKLTLNQDKLQEGHMRWQKDAIHSCLTEFKKEGAYKDAKKNALKTFKDIQVYMGDRKPSKHQKLNKNVAIEILQRSAIEPSLRAEIYLHIIKQVNGNPSPGSAQKGWDLMILALNAFQPGKDFENYLEYFLKQFAPDKKRYILTFHTLIYDPSRNLQVPSGSDYDMIVSGRDIRQPQFTDQAPPGAPSWQDILGNWEDRDDEDDGEITFTANRQNRSDRPVKELLVRNTTNTREPTEPQPIVQGWGTGTIRSSLNEPLLPVTEEQYDGVWIELVDPESGYPYYENTETGVTQWEKPAEMP
eukprot:423279_1